jgi:hypothetical protein
MSLYFFSSTLPEKTNQILSAARVHFSHFLQMVAKPEYMHLIGRISGKRERYRILNLDSDYYY